MKKILSLCWVSSLACVVSGHASLLRQGSAVTGTTQSKVSDGNNIVFDDEDNESPIVPGHDDGAAPAVAPADNVASDQAFGEYADEVNPPQPVSRPVAAQVQEQVQVQESISVPVQDTAAPIAAPIQDTAAPIAAPIQDMPDGPYIPQRGPMPVIDVPNWRSAGGSAPARSKETSLVAAKKGGRRAPLVSPILQEYDDSAAEGDPVGKPGEDEQVSVQDHEPETFEDVQREATGDLDKVVPVVHKRALKRKTVPSPKPKLSQVAGSAHAQTAAKVHQRGPKGAMKDQCTAYTNYLKGQDIKGPELLRVMKSTCAPAIQAGEASQQYTLMCNALGGAVEKFLVAPAVPWGEICDAILRVFHESGVGEF